MTVYDENAYANSKPAKNAPGGSVFDLILSVFDYLKDRHKTRKANRERRDAFKNLLRADAKLLHDIGLTRDDVLWASNLPLHINAAEELQKIRDGEQPNARWR